MAYLGSGNDEIEKTVSTINMVCDTMTGSGSVTTMTISASQEICLLYTSDAADE